MSSGCWSVASFPRLPRGALHLNTLARPPPPSQPPLLMFPGGEKGQRGTPPRPDGPGPTPGAAVGGKGKKGWREGAGEAGGGAGLSGRRVVRWSLPSPPEPLSSGGQRAGAAAWASGAPSLLCPQPQHRFPPRVQLSLPDPPSAQRGASWCLSDQALPGPLPPPVRRGERPTVRIVLSGSCKRRGGV